MGICVLPPVGILLFLASSASCDCASAHLHFGARAVDHCLLLCSAFLLLRFSATEHELSLSASALLLFRFPASESRTTFCRLPRSALLCFLANARSTAQQEAGPKEHLVVSRVRERFQTKIKNVSKISKDNERRNHQNKARKKERINNRCKEGKKIQK